MAGLGKRFEEAGYRLPKPFIDVQGKPMIIRVIENLLGYLNNENIKITLIAQKSHCDRFNIIEIFQQENINPCRVIQLEGLTEGTACTLLKAKKYINNDEELIVANSDQLVLDPDFLENGLNYFRKKNADGGIWCFIDSHIKWSFAKLAPDHTVCEVAEKIPISNLATVGVYYFKKGSSFVHGAEAMIEKNIRVNNEFYTCPVYNQIIANGEKILVYMINEMVGLGTPEDLNNYLKDY